MANLLVGNNSSQCLWSGMHSRALNECQNAVPLNYLILGVLARLALELTVVSPCRYLKAQTLNCSTVPRSHNKTGKWCWMWQYVPVSSKGQDWCVEEHKARDYLCWPLRTFLRKTGSLRHWLIAWCCFYYFSRHSLIALLEALRARITNNHVFVVCLSIRLCYVIGGNFEQIELQTKLLDDFFWSNKNNRWNVANYVENCVTLIQKKNSCTWTQSSKLGFCSQTKLEEQRVQEGKKFQGRG